MISYKGYTGVFQYDETIDALAGHMVDIAGEIYFEGRSVEEVKESARRAVDHYLQACEARGVNPDRPYSGKITVSTSPEVHRAIAVAAGSRQLLDEPVGGADAGGCGRGEGRKGSSRRRLTSNHLPPAPPDSSRRKPRLTPRVVDLFVALLAQTAPQPATGDDGPWELLQ